MSTFKVISRIVQSGLRYVVHRFTAAGLVVILKMGVGGLMGVKRASDQMTQNPKRVKAGEGIKTLSWWRCSRLILSEAKVLMS